MIFNERTQMTLKKIESCCREKIIAPGSSSVIIPLIEINEELHILFEQRSLKLSFQPGDVCFPGGKIEKGETPQEAAIRECLEELYPSYQEPDNIQILSPISPIIGPAGKTVYPFVAYLTNYDFTFSADEVQKVFTYPISFFKEHSGSSYPMKKITLAPDNFPYDLISKKGNYNFSPEKYDMWIYDDTDPIIWGFTGRLLHRFLEGIFISS